MSRLRTHLVASVMVWFLLFCLGCTGKIGAGVGSGGDDDGDDDGDPGEPRDLCEPGEANVPGPRLLRRLTSTEYTASVRDVLGFTPADWAGAALPADAAARNGFTNNADRLAVDPAYAEGLLGTSKQVAGLVTQAPHLARVLPCSAQGGEACARSFLETTGRRIFRRPLTSVETARYLTLYQSVLAEDDFTTWVYWATVGLLSSPHFVYRAELGEAEGDGYRLTGYEIATALAYNLTGRPPSDALLDRVAAGGLDSNEEIATVARELAIDPVTGQARPELREVILKLSDQWLGLSALGNLQKTESFPDFAAEVRASMKRETDALVAHVVFEQGGGVSELLTSPTTYLDQTLTTYYGYGFTGPGAPIAALRPAGWGVGILSQGSLLAINAGNTHTSPTQRGVLVRERFLCYDMPPPPPLVGDLPQPTGNETTRERYEDIHAGNESCAGCHAMMDPIGFAFEHLDASGRFRADEGGLTIDDSGYIRGLDAADVTFTGPAELAARLAERPEVGTCVASYLASYAYGLDHHDTSCLVTDLAEAFAAGDLGILDFYIQLAQAPHFSRRVDDAP